MKDVRELKDKATKLIGKGKFAAALEVWQEVVKLAPDDVPARQKIGEMLQRLGRDRDAVDVYEDVAARYARQGHFYKASAVCRVLLTIEPVHERTQELIASLFARAQLPPPTAKQLPRVEAQGDSGDDFELDIEVELAPPSQGDLPAIPLFSTLTHEELKAILNSSMEVRSFAPGEVIVAEGAPGDSMFALVEGKAGVFRAHGRPEQRRVAEVDTGDIFGEAAMVSGGPRLATVAADGDVVALEFSREAMRRVIAAHPNVGRKLELFYRQRLLQNILRASPLMRLLPEEDKEALSTQFQATKFSTAEVLVREGDPVDAVHLLLRGVCAVTHASGERYPDLREGDLIGEISTLTGTAASATVIAAGPALTLRLPAETFKNRLLAHPAAAEAVREVVRARLERTAALDAAEDTAPGWDLRI